MLFSLSVAGIFINRKNVILLLMCIELMLLAVNFNFIAFSRMLDDPHGPGVRVLHLDGRGRGSRDRPRDPGRAVPQHAQHQRRRARQAEGLGAWRTVYLTIVLAPLVAAVVAGLFGKRIGRAGAHWVTIIGVAVSFVLSLSCCKYLVLDGGEPYNGTRLPLGVDRRHATSRWVSSSTG